jgi:membrane-bound metal-dependent hydrolase YbcI (DUF457 family)
MFVGHFGVALAAKKLEPKINLGVLFAASQLIDLAWPVFVLLGLEHVSPRGERLGMNTLSFDSYPYSHSLLGTILWSVAFAALIYALTKSSRRSGVVFFVTLSHWFLDLLVHEKDLQLGFDASQKFGLELWRFPGVEIVLESAICIAGMILYWRAVRFQSRAQKISFGLLMAVLYAIYLASVLGPAPAPETSGIAIATPALLMWLFVLWAWALDRRVQVRARP